MEINVNLTKLPVVDYYHLKLLKRIKDQNFVIQEIHPYFLRKGMIIYAPLGSNKNDFFQSRFILITEMNQRHPGKFGGWRAHVTGIDLVTGTKHDHVFGRNCDLVLLPSVNYEVLDKDIICNFKTNKKCIVTKLLHYETAITAINYLKQNEFYRQS